MLVMGIQAWGRQELAVDGKTLILLSPRTESQTLMRPRRIQTTGRALRGFKDPYSIVEMEVDSVGSVTIASPLMVATARSLPRPDNSWG